MESAQNTLVNKLLNHPERTCHPNHGNVPKLDYMNKQFYVEN
jgi:hypothetical protein